MTHKKTKYRSQKLRKGWCELDDFKYWLRRIDNDPFKSKCTLYNIIIIAEFSNIKVHSKGKKHNKYVKGILNRQKSIKYFISNGTTSTQN